MKQRMKTIVKVLLLLSGITLLMRLGTKVYFNAFGGPVTAPSEKGHWRSVKQTFGYDTARDMDSKENIKERVKDVVKPH